MASSISWRETGRRRRALGTSRLLLLFEKFPAQAENASKKFARKFWGRGRSLVAPSILGCMYRGPSPEILCMHKSGGVHAEFSYFGNVFVACVISFEPMRYHTKSKSPHPTSSGNQDLSVLHNNWPPTQHSTFHATPLIDSFFKNVVLHSYVLVLCMDWGNANSVHATPPAGTTAHATHLVVHAQHNISIFEVFVIFFWIRANVLSGAQSLDMTFIGHDLSTWQCD